jgi:hypothetical protein
VFPPSRKAAKRCFLPKRRGGMAPAERGPCKEWKLGRPLLIEVAPLLSKVAYLV